MPGSVVGAALNGTFQAIDTAVQNKYNKEAAERQFEYDKEMAALQNEYNVNMWRMNNEYNTPSAQMQRLVDAGLNPNLVYGSVSTGNSSSAPTQIAPGRKAVTQQAGLSKLGSLFDVVGLISAFQGLQKQKIENDILRNEERTRFFDANLLQEYYNGRVLYNMSLAPKTDLGVTVEKPMSRSMARYYKRGYAMYVPNDTADLSRTETKYETMNAGYQVDLSKYRKLTAQKDYENYEIDKWLGRIAMGINAFSNLTGGLLPIKKLFDKKPSLQRTYNTYHTYNTFNR